MSEQGPRGPRDGDGDGGRRNAKGRQRPERAHGGRERSAQRPSERNRGSDPQRLAAYTVLRAVADGAYANLELPKVLRDRGIHGRDAAFTTELVYGAVRMHGLYDPIISVAAGRPVAKIDPNVLDTLRLGAHQLLGMRVPTHAAVDETVGLARKVNGAGAAGFVNAVMRRVSERDLDAWLAEVVPAGELSAQLAVEQSHPEWIVKALRAALLGHGAATAETVDAELTALVTSDNAAGQGLARRPTGAGHRRASSSTPAPSASPLSPVGAVLEGGDPGGIPAVREGRAAVQDEGSQLVALALAAVPVERTGARSATRAVARPVRRTRRQGRPAGRPGHRGGRRPHRQRGQRAPHRPGPADAAPRHRAGRATAGRSVTVRTGDGRTVGEDEPGRYDRVLVDAPCTGLGALRRRPEARWRRTPADLADLGKLQRELLASAIDATAAGGVIAYATCSPHLAETSFVVGDVTKRRTDVELLDAREFVRGADGGAGRRAGNGADRAAVAAPARHRRHVPGAAAQEGLTRSGRSPAGPRASSAGPATGIGATGGRLAHR